jgi:hypothetical protein
MMFTQMDRSAHHLTAMPGDSPTPGARDFGNQAMGVAAAKGKTDLSALFSCVVDANLRM